MKTKVYYSFGIMCLAVLTLLPGTTVVNAMKVSANFLAVDVTIIDMGCHEHLLRTRGRSLRKSLQRQRS